MKLLTDELKKILPALYSTEDIKCEDQVFVCKFFNPNDFPNGEPRG